MTPTPAPRTPPHNVAPGPRVAQPGARIHSVCVCLGPTTMPGDGVFGDAPPQAIPPAAADSSGRPSDLEAGSAASSSSVTHSYDGDTGAMAVVPPASFAGVGSSAPKYAPAIRATGSGCGHCGDASGAGCGHGGGGGHHGGRHMHSGRRQRQYWGGGG